jgi:hypothetical protein
VLSARSLRIIGTGTLGRIQQQSLLDSGAVFRTRGMNSTSIQLYVEN